ncbi:unnamed protein product [Symbiodinium sp. CCMP2592]|nr:unnamed protein product [Symbiodinium sp. CCMP2592]
MSSKAAAALAAVQLGDASNRRRRRVSDITQIRLDAILSKTKDFVEDLCSLVEPGDVWRARFFGVQKKKREKQDKNQPADATDKKKKQKKQKKEKKDEYILNPKNTSCPRVLRGLCHILRSETKDAVAFNRVKIIYDPKGGASGMTAAGAGRLRPTLVMSAWKGDGAGMIWSYINGVDAEADNHMPWRDGRFPWAFVQAPSFCVVGEWVGGKKMSPAMSDALQQSGFLVASDRSSLAELPEAMATGSLLSKLAAKRFRVEHPGAKKARHIPACIQGPSPGIYLLASAALRCGNQLSARRACVTAAGQHVQMRPSELRTQLQF